MPLDIIDFHSHFVDPDWEITTARRGNAANRARWTRTNAILQDEGDLLADIETGDIVGRVVSTPPEFLSDDEGNVPAETLRLVNEKLSALVERHPGRLHALASVDPWGGEAAARELERAVTRLGLSGVFLPSARGDLLLDAPQARPVLETAANLGVAAFVHPINPQPLADRMEPYGRLGTLFARGTINAATVIALVESGTLEALPDLRIVVTGLAVSSILLGAAFGGEDAGGKARLATFRRQLFVETMGFDPILIRAFADTVGTSNLVAGSDWPIVSTGPIADRLEWALTAAGIAPDQQRAIAGANALKLLTR